MIGAGAILALVAAIAFWPVVSGSRSFFHGDLRYEHLPIWDVTQKALLSGESPFWLEGMYCGHPLLFTQEAPLFYPLTVPLLLTGAPVHRLADLFSLFHFWLAGFAAFLLLRDLKADSLSALFGGLAWMLSARMVQSAIWPNAVAVSALLPLLVCGVLRIGRGERRSGVLCAALSGGLLLLASRPQAVLGAAPFLMVIGGWAIAHGPKKGRALLDLLSAGLLALTLGAPSLLPSAILYPETSRAGGLERGSRDFRPIAFGNDDLKLVFLPFRIPLGWPEAAAYPGVLVGLLFLVGIGMAVRRNFPFPRSLFAALAAGGLVGLIFAFGERGPYGLFAGLPLIRGFRIPARFLTSWAFALPLASALVLSRLLLEVSRPRILAAVCLGILSIDLIPHALRTAPTAPAEIQTIQPDLVNTLRRQLSKDETGFARRFWSATSVVPMWRYEDNSKVTLARLDPLFGALGMRWGLESVSGEGPPLRRMALILDPPSRQAARLAGVGALVFVAGRGTNSLAGVPAQVIIRRFESFPRALIVPAAVVVDESRAIAATLDPTRDPRRTAILEEGEPLVGRSRVGEPFGSARLLSEKRSQIELAVSLPASGLLILHNSFERGWRATVDGEPAPVLRADAAFLGLRLAPGAHRVHFEYRPRGLLEGAGLCIVGILGLLLVAIRLPDADTDGKGSR